jgi:hypothetical protein
MAMARLQARRDEIGWREHPAAAARMAAGGGRRSPGDPPATIAPKRPALAKASPVPWRLRTLLVLLVVFGMTTFLLPAAGSRVVPASPRPALLLVAEGQPPGDVAPFVAALREAGFAVTAVRAGPGMLAGAAVAELDGRRAADAAPVMLALGQEAAEVVLSRRLGGEVARAAVAAGCPAVGGDGPVMLVTAGPAAGCAAALPPGAAHLAVPRPVFAGVLMAGNGAWFTGGRGDVTTRRRVAQEVATWLAASAGATAVAARLPITP